MDSEAGNKYLANTLQCLADMSPKMLEPLATEISRVAKRDGVLWVLGNGGSASTASHLVCDLSKGVNLKSSGRLRTIAVSEQIAIMSAYLNDAPPELAFLNYMRIFVREEDMVLFISGSGNSKNLILLAEDIKVRGISSSALLGGDGGKLLPLVNTSVVVPSFDMQVIENLHLVIVHWLFKVLG